MKIKYDDTDAGILKALQHDSRLSVRQLSAKVHRSPAAVFERLRRLEKEGDSERVYHNRRPREART